MNWIVSVFSLQLEKRWLHFQREWMFLAPVKKEIRAVGCEHQLCKLCSRYCKRVWHCPLKSAGVRTKSFTLGMRATPLLYSLCIFSPFYFPALRAHSCNINHEFLLAKNPLKWQQLYFWFFWWVVFGFFGFLLGVFFGKMNEQNQMTRWLCPEAFTQGWVPSVLACFFLKSPPLLLYTF